MNIFLVELTGYNPATSSTETLRFATRQLGDFEERIRRAGFVKRDMFSSGTTFGGSRPSFGDIELVNSALLDAEGDLDYLNDYAFDGRDIAVYWGPSDGDYPDGFTLLYQATMEAVLVAREKVTIRILGNAARVDLPLRDEFFAGTGGVEGDENIAGKPKPFSFGRVNSMQPVAVNTEKNVYQVHNGPINAITVYDQGKPMSSSGQLFYRTGDDIPVAGGYSIYYVEELGRIIVIGDTEVVYTDDFFATTTTITVDVTSGVVRNFIYDNDTGYIGVVRGSSGISLVRTADLTSWTENDPVIANDGYAQSYSVPFVYSPDRDEWLTAYQSLRSGTVYTVIMQSPDTYTWTEVAAITPSSTNTEITWAGGSIQSYSMIIGNDAYLSPDGVTWDFVADLSAFGSGSEAIFYDDDTELLISTWDDGIVVSADGITWDEVAAWGSAGSSLGVIKKAPDGNFYLMVEVASDTYELYTSPDALTWTTTSVELSVTFFEPNSGLFAWPFWLGIYSVNDSIWLSYISQSYLTASDMLRDDAAPASGTFKPYLPGGYLRMADSATGQVTADVTVGDTAADRTIAKAFVAVMDELGTTFTPAELFADGTTKGVWFDPSDPSTVWQDAAGTTPAGDGDPVGRIDDKSGNGYHATQSTDTARPVLRKTGDVWALEFDGVDDHLTMPSMSFTGTEDFFFSVGARRDSSASTMYLWNMGLSGFSTSYPGMSIGPQDFSNNIVRLWMSDGTTAASRTAGQWGNTGERVMTVGRSDIYIDQTRQGWSSDITQSFAGQQTRNHIGCRDVGFAKQAFWNGTIEQIVFMLRDATTQEREDVTQFIGRRGDFGLPTPGDPPFYDDVSVSVLDSIAPYECGFFLDTTEAIAANVLDQIANSVGAYWGDDRNGLFRIEQIGDPSIETAVATVRDYDMTEPLERLRTQDRGRGVPFWRVALQYARRYTTIASDFDASVSDAERLRLSTPFDVESYEDAGIRTVHLLSQELIVDTLLQDATDAITEATRQWDLRSVKRDRYQFAVKIDADSVQWDVGDVLRIEHPRFGLASGKNFWIIGLQLNPRPQTITVTIWG